MSKHLNLQEVAIAIAAKNLNPTVLNPDFLKYTEIIPTDWELARPPVYTNQLSQLLFSNGIGIVAQPNQIVFAETIGSKDLKGVQIVEAACRCIETLSKVEYQAVGINPTGFVTYDSEDAAYQYLCKALLSPGSWQEFGEAQMKAGLQLSYTLKRGQLNLGINQVVLKAPDQHIPAILFSGNFNHPVVGSSQSDQLEDLKHLIRGWQDNVALYQQLIEAKFLPTRTELLDAVPLAVNS